MRAVNVIVVIVLSLQNVASQNYGLLYTEVIDQPDVYSQHCIMYNPRFHELPYSIEEAIKHPLHDLVPSTLCDDSGVPLNISGAAVALSRGGCTFTEKATVVQSHDGLVALIVSKEEMSVPAANSSADYNSINITVALVSDSDYQEIKRLGDKLYVMLYAPEPPHIDYNLIIIWVLATGTVAAGAYWSGTVKHQQALKKHKKKQQGDTQDDADDEPESLDISPKLIFIFVVLMCGMLVCLYYLFRFLVYIVIGMFALAASMALYTCLKPLMLRISCIGHCRMPPVKLPFMQGRLEVRRFILGLFCIGVAVFWVVIRNEPYAWMIQDILGVLCCMTMMRTLRFPNLQSICILLVLLFIYDVFFVFITPLFTSNGKSVMVDVATGGSNGDAHETKEKLPMMLMVPRFTRSVLSMCNMPYSLLGFGDMLVPGFLISFCYGFDLKVNSGKVYYLAATVAYGVGLLITFVALAVMEMGQPALLYLVPCTLLTTLAIAAKRRELPLMWNGKIPNQKRKEKTSSDEKETSSSTVAAGNTTITHRTNSEQEIASLSSQDSQSMLINK